MRSITYTKLNVYLITLILTIFSFIGCYRTYSFLQMIFLKDTIVHETTSTSCNNIDVQVTTDANYDKTPQNAKDSTIEYSPEATWKIEIPSINLEAPIREGTSQNVLYTSVGHFENTNLFDGNVGLAAHNRRLSCKLFC